MLDMDQLRVVAELLESGEWSDEDYAEMCGKALHSLPELLRMIDESKERILEEDEKPFAALRKSRPGVSDSQLIRELVHQALGGE